MEEKQNTSMPSCSQSTLKLHPTIERNFSFPGTSSGTPSVYPSSTPPLTIFFNGAVGIFHLSADQAEYIMEMAERVNNGEDSMAKGNSNHQGPLAKLREDLPISRKRSLQRFLEKRKERLATLAP